MQNHRLTTEFSLDPITDQIGKTMSVSLSNDFIVAQVFLTKEMMPEAKTMLEDAHDLVKVLSSFILVNECRDQNEREHLCLIQK